jgi:hypothetical protein
MALAIFDARPERVIVGELFDTNKRYIYKDTTGGTGPSFVEYATSPTIVGVDNRLTYSFGGDIYYINAPLSVSDTKVKIGVN